MVQKHVGKSSKPPATTCDVGVYVLQNRMTGKTYVGTSTRLDQRSRTSLHQRADCLGKSADVQVVKIPTCGMSRSDRLTLERALIKVTGVNRPTCNVRIPRR